MKKFTLIRIAYIPDGTFGVLLDEEIPFCLTLEREWKNNEKNISCIPRGKYVCKRVQSPKFGDTFEVLHVPGRSAILFHIGNIEDDTHGCIVTGEYYGKWKGKIAVRLSGKAVKEFKERTKDLNYFELEITDGNKNRENS